MLLEALLGKNVLLDQVILKGNVLLYLYTFFLHMTSGQNTTKCNRYFFSIVYTDSVSCLRCIITHSFLFRRCSDTPVPDNQERCALGTYHGEIARICFCKGRLCNSASISGVSMLVIFMSTIMALNNTIWYSKLLGCSLTLYFCKM